jgi:D-amino peptidase
MRVLISADMEGATGVTWPADVEPGTEQWQRCRRMFTSDVNAAIGGFFAAGADEVLVTEAHATMRNLLLEELDRRAVMLTGRHKELSMVEGIQDPEVGAVAFVGYHAAAGAEGVLAHTFLANSITSVRVNGELGSEGRLNAYVAAEYGVPVVLVTGDDRACADAAGYAPQALTVAVKDCVSRYAAVCRPPEVTAAAIAAAAARAGKLARRRPPGGPDAPAEASAAGAGAAGASATAPAGFAVEIEVDAAQLAQAAAIVPTVTRTGDRTVSYHSPTAWDMIRCFKTVTTMIAAATEDRYG